MGEKDMYIKSANTVQLKVFSTLPQSGLARVLLLVLMTLLSACGGNGSAKPEEAAAPSAAAKTSPIASGDIDCPNGGLLVETGIDDNRNGVLDVEEVDSSEKLCNGLNSHNSLLAMNDEPAGSHCPYAGIRLDSGVDLNDDGILDNNEISNSSYVCNRLDTSLGWQSSTRLEKVADAAYYPQVAFSADGSAMAIWHIAGGSGNALRSSLFQPGQGWGISEQVSTAGGAFDPRLGMDDSGHAIVVWIENDGIRDNIWSARYSPGSGWDTAQLIETANKGDASVPQISVDAVGNAFAIWQYDDGIRNNIMANQYLVGVGWGIAQLVESDDINTATDPQIVMDKNLNAIAVWRQWDGTRFNIRSNRYTAGLGWGRDQLIESNNSGDASYPQIAIDQSGNAMAIWQLDNGPISDIHANIFFAGSGWGNAELIDTEDLCAAYFPQVGMDANGNAIAVWAQISGLRSNIWSNRFTLGGGWSGATLIETDTSNVGAPQIAVDAQGNALAVWRQDYASKNSIWANRYAQGFGWGHAELIEFDDSGHAAYPQISIDAAGNGLAVWMQFDTGDNSINANEWIAP